MIQSLNTKASGRSLSLLMMLIFSVSLGHFGLLRAQATQPSGAGATTQPSGNGADQAVILEMPKDLGTVPMLIKTSMGDIEIEVYQRVAPLTTENFIGLSMGTKEFIDPASGQKVKRPMYDNLVFHRVLKDFMIQTGSPNGRGDGSPGYRFKDEINARMLGLDKMPVKVVSKTDPTKVGVHPWLLVRSQRDFLTTLIFPMARKMGIASQQDLQNRYAEVLKAATDQNLMQAYETLGYQYDSSIPSLPMKRGYLAMANAGPNTNGSQFYILQKDSDYLTGKHTVFGKVIKGMDVVDKIAGVQVNQQGGPLKPVVLHSIRVIEK